MTTRPQRGQGSDELEAAATAPTPRRRSVRLDEQAPPRAWWRYRLIRSVLRTLTAVYSRLDAEGPELLPAGPAILCFSHENWADPFFLISVLPVRPRTHFFGPEQNDMTRGFRNRLIRWGGVAVPYRPGGRGLIAATARVDELLGAGDYLAIAGEGRIHAGEAVVLPLLEGPAYLSLRAGVPLVPVSINGTSWLAFRRRVRVRIGRPIEPPQRAPDARGPRRPTAEAVSALSETAHSALLELVADFPDPPRSRWIGGFLTELFNDWPEGSRPPVPPRGGASEGDT